MEERRKGPLTIDKVIPDEKEVVGLEAGKEQGPRGLAGQCTPGALQGRGLMAGATMTPGRGSLSNVRPLPHCSLAQSPCRPGGCLPPALGYSFSGPGWTPSPRVTSAQTVCLPLHPAASFSWTKEILLREPEPRRGRPLPSG